LKKSNICTPCCDKTCKPSPFPPPQSSWPDTLGIALTDQFADGSVKFTYKKYTLSNAYNTFYTRNSD